MKPGLRKLALTAHVTSSVGWLGAVVVYLVLAITGLTSDDSQLARAAYLNLESVGWFVIVPFCLAALITGLVQSLGTEWGLFGARTIKRTADVEINMLGVDCSNRHAVDRTFEHCRCPQLLRRHPHPARAMRSPTKRGRARTVTEQVTCHVVTTTFVM